VRTNSPVGYRWSEIPEFHKRNGIWAAIPIGRKPLTADLDYDLVLVSGAEQSDTPYIPRVQIVGCSSPDDAFKSPDEFVWLRHIQGYQHCAVEMFQEIRGVIPSGYPKDVFGKTFYERFVKDRPDPSVKSVRIGPSFLQRPPSGSDANELAMHEHVTFQSKHGSISNQNGIAALSVRVEGTDVDSEAGNIGIAKESGKNPYFYVWSEDGTKTDPMIFGPMGLRWPDPQTGEHICLSFAEIGVLVKRLRAGLDSDLNKSGDDRKCPGVKDVEQTDS